MDYYANQPLTTLQATKTLTASYVDTGTINVKSMQAATLYVTYIPKTGQTDRNLSFKVSMSDNASTPVFFTEQLEQSANGASGEKVTTAFDYIRTLPGAVGGTTYAKRFMVTVADTESLKLSFKEDGSTDFGSVAIQIVRSGL